MPLSQLYIENRKAPFIRLLIALSAGLVLQWYVPVLPIVSILVFLAALCAYLLFSFVSPAAKFHRRWVQGMSIFIMLMAAGSLLCFIKNPLHQTDNYTGVYKTGDAIVATVN